MQIPTNFLKGLLMAFLCSFTFFASSQQSDWTWQNPSPQGNWLRDVKVINENLIFATGQGGTIMKSNDCGINWTILNTGNTKLLRRAKFLQNGLVGYASGANSSLIKTTNGGVNWQQLPVNRDIDVYAMDFPDEKTGFIGGYPGNRIFKTTDGGLTWAQSDSLPCSGISTIKFPFNKLTGFAGGSRDSVIYKTIDGGLTWIQKPIPFQSMFHDIRSFWFVNEQTGYAAGYGTILKTTDFGETWVSVYTGNGSFNSICFPENETTGYVVGDFNTVLKTTDSGSSWQVVNTNVSGTHFYNSVEFANNQLGFIVGEKGIILKTTDGGINWSNFRTECTLRGLNSIDFPVNAQTGYIAEYGILKTTDGGNTWIEQNVSATINKIKFIDNDTGYIVGVNGAIFKTINGGQNWDYLLSGINQYLFDVEFPVNSITGYVSGLSGKLAKTTDGGNTWTSIGSFSKDILAMSFPTDNLIGYVATAYQRIYKTTDGGATWEIKYDGNIPGAKMSDILFPFDAQTGYALSYGNGSKILKTTDGGNNWQTIDPGIAQELLSISFPTPQIGYITAFHDNFSSILLKTTDSGLTWNKVPVPYAYALNSVCFPNGVDTGYIVGVLSGAILKTVNGGGIFTSVTDSPIRYQNPDNTLVQNYPNPFTESTTVIWELPEDAHAVLKVYDFTGREVKTLVDGNLAKGEHKAKFDATGLPAGVYFYRLRVNGKVETKKMVYLK
jgi:photosystem II stability/assembly factor-like uncharacterized protein